MKNLNLSFHKGKRMNFNKNSNLVWIFNYERIFFYNENTNFM